MTSLAAATRRPTLAILMLVSIALGAVGLWAWLGPDTVDSISTARLAAVLGLLVAPAATGAALVYERHRRGAVERRAPEARRGGAEPEPVVARDICLPGGSRLVGAGPRPGRTPAITR